MYGGNDDDVLAGGDGTDNCQGNNGNDVLTANGGCEDPPSAERVSSDTAALTVAGDRAVVRAAEGEGLSWSDGGGANPVTEVNPAAKFLPNTAGGTSNDVVGGNVTANGDT